jgi:hypothetical protein
MARGAGLAHDPVPLEYSIEWLTCAFASRLQLGSVTANPPASGPCSRPATSTSGSRTLSSCSATADRGASPDRRAGHRRGQAQRVGRSPDACPCEAARDALGPQGARQAGTRRWRGPRSREFPARGPFPQVVLTLTRTGQPRRAPNPPQADPQRPHPRVLHRRLTAHRTPKSYFRAPQARPRGTTTPPPEPCCDWLWVRPGRGVVLSRVKPAIRYRLPPQRGRCPR